MVHSRKKGEKGPDAIRLPGGSRKISIPGGKARCGPDEKTDGH
jgi:hypothetical protein